MGRRALIHRVSVAETLGELDQPAIVGERNRAVASLLTPTIPSDKNIHAEAAVKLKARASGLFLFTVSALQAAAAQTEVVTWTLMTYMDAVAGVPLTLSVNAAAAGVNCFYDSDGTGILLLGANAGNIFLADTETIATAGVGSKFSWAGIVGTSGNGGAIPYGWTFVVTLSITNSATARAVTELSLSAYELG